MGVLAPAQTLPILVSQTAEPPAAALHLGWEHIKHAGIARAYQPWSIVECNERRAQAKPQFAVIHGSAAGIRTTYTTTGATLDGHRGNDLAGRSNYRARYCRACAGVLFGAHERLSVGSRSVQVPWAYWPRPRHRPY